MGFLKSLNLRDFFVQHGDKIVLGVCALLMVAFTVMAFAARTYDKRPRDLEKLAGDLRDKVANSQFRQDELPGADDYVRKAKQLEEPVAITTFQWGQLFCNPFSEQQQIRRRPELLAAKSPRVVAEKASLSIRETAAPAAAAPATGAPPAK